MHVCIRWMHICTCKHVDTIWRSCLYEHRFEGSNHSFTTISITKESSQIALCTNVREEWNRHIPVPCTKHTSTLNFSSAWNIHAYSYAGMCIYAHAHACLYAVHRYTHRNVNKHADITLQKLWMSTKPVSHTPKVWYIHADFAAFNHDHVIRHSSHVDLLNMFSEMLPTPRMASPHRRHHNGNPILSPTATEPCPSVGPRLCRPCLQTSPSLTPTGRPSSLWGTCERYSYLYQPLTWVHGLQLRQWLSIVTRGLSIVNVSNSYVFTLSNSFSLFFLGIDLAGW